MPKVAPSCGQAILFASFQGINMQMTGASNREAQNDTARTILMPKVHGIGGNAHCVREAASARKHSNLAESE